MNTCKKVIVGMILFAFLASPIISHAASTKSIERRIKTLYSRIENLQAKLVEKGATAMFSADLNDDGVVNGVDLGIVLNSWGECDGEEICEADLNGDEEVDQSDVYVILGFWTEVKNR